jgi:Na+-transporting NADH:ubiquinone oxidoreductase subunit A
VLIPGDRLEQVAPPGIYPVPLMRALQLGDAERARELGALELVEEDVAPLTHACISNNDYGLLLRNVLDQLEAGR